MAAHPKNKITRVEQGKRRAGNTPKLKKDASANFIPLHKRGFFDRVVTKFNLKWTTKTTKNKKGGTLAEQKKARKTSAARHQAHQTSVVSSTAQSTPKMGPMPTVKKTRNTQHKGG